jgi:hypothetical protein
MDRAEIVRGLKRLVKAARKDTDFLAALIFL